MGADEIAVFIPIFAMCIPIVAIVTKHRRRLAEMHLMAGVGPQARMSEEAAQRIKALEDRVRVLERIVTDANGNGGLTLAREIEALRDVRNDSSPLAAPIRHTDMRQPALS